MIYDEPTALRALLSSSPDLIYFLDREGKPRYAGPAAAAAGLPDDARFDAQRREVMESGRSIRDEASIGSTVVEYVIAPVVAEEETLGTVVVTRDVTERRRAETALRESEAKFSIAFDRSPLALTITSLEDGRLVNVNEGFITMSGYTREEAVGRRPDELGLWVDPSMREERFLKLRRGEPVPDVEATFRIKNGEELIGVVGSAVVEINGRPCVLSSVVDITARKRADEAKDAFLATLSHELRTPLTAAYGWVKLLGRARDAELLETGLRAIEESLATQIRLIDDLLDVSRIAAGKMQIDLHAADLGAIVDSAVETVRPSAEAKKIDIRVHADAVLTVRGDSGRLKQVVWNLLSNAIKFSPSGGVVDVTLRRRGELAEIVIHDTGEGIDPEFLPHVFDRFRQADSSISRRHGGLGLGLSIVSSLVEAHGGSVRAESEGAARGATFTVALPLIESAIRPLAPRVHAGVAKLDGARVLIVDDDSGAREVMRTALTAAGADVRACPNALEAFATFEEWRPHVVVSDLAMPGDDGYSLIRRIRGSGHDVPALAITAYVRREDEARVREAGFQRHVAKPFDPDELVQAVRELAR